MKQLIRLGCLALLASGSIHAGAADTSTSKAMEAHASASHSTTTQQIRKAKKDEKVQLGVAKLECGAMHNDEKKGCEKEAARRARTVYKEEMPASAPK